MPINMTNLAATLQAMVDGLGPETTVKDLLLVSKAIEAAVGSVAVSEVNAAGTDQVNAVNAAGAAQAAVVADAANAVRSGSVGGTANAITLACSPAVNTLTSPLVIAFVATADNAGAVTVDVDGLGAKVVTDPTGAALAAGAIKNGRLCLIAWYATGFRLVGDAFPARLDQAQTYPKPVRTGWAALVDGTTIAVDFNLSNNFFVTLGGARTIAAPSNVVPGQCGIIKLRQDATGNRTLVWNSAWKWEGGAPTLSTSAGAVDAVYYYVEDDGTVTALLLSKGRA